MFVKCLLLLFVLGFVEAEYYYHRQLGSPCALPRIKNGRVRPKQRGTIFRFSCTPRYTLVGNRYATCRYGKWDSPPPVCVRSGCPPLEEVKNSVNMTYHDNAWTVFFCLPGYQLAGSSAIYCDGSTWNTTAPGCFNSSAVQATECDFEQPDICGWKPDEIHDFDWRRLNKKTPSSFLQTGPTYDHTYGKSGSGYYMYIESTGRVENETARLLSPVYDAKVAVNGCFVFWYHMFGRSMGGLRVYQKPDSVSMYELLGSRREKHIIFEQWGDQGNEWYSGVSMLSDVGGDFQIVIEGVRGDSFMSDLAIDDVSIRHGENCTKAMQDATTPPSVLQESCVGRCDPYAEATGYRGCSCSIVCIVTQNCCPDFLDVCDFDTRSTSESYPSSSSVAQPQTQKLVATSTEKWINTPTPTTVPTPATRQTPRRMNSTKATTLSIAFTTKPKPKPTTIPTIKPTTTSTSTTATITTTTLTTTTPKPVPKTTTTTKPTIKPIVTQKATTKTTEVTPKSSSTVFVRRQTNDMSVEKNAEKEKQSEVVAKKIEGMSGATIAVTVLLVSMALVGTLWGGYMMSRSRGVAALARLRGRTTADPEVHYLRTDVDDDDE